MLEGVGGTQVWLQTQNLKPGSPWGLGREGSWDRLEISPDPGDQVLWDKKIARVRGQGSVLCSFYPGRPRAVWRSPIVATWDLL